MAMDDTPVLGLPDVAAVADRVYPQVFRHDFRAPGFALVSLGPSVGSRPLRRFMVSLKERLAVIHHGLSGRHLVYLSMGRFDQQETTKFHLDSAPDESFLMLGYEPTPVRSELAVADYTRAAFDLGVDPKTFLDDYNPMFSKGEGMLAPYVTRVKHFDPASAQVLLVNNSAEPFSRSVRNMLGVMHQASVPNPDPGRARVVNSTMIGTAAGPDDGPVPEAARRAFTETDEIAKKFY